MGGKPERVTVDRLKPAHLDVDEPVQLALPPRRGHPPAAASGLAPPPAQALKLPRALDPLLLNAAVLAA